MSALAGLVAQLGFRETGGGSYTNKTSEQFTFPSGGPNPETLETADGVPLRVRARDEYVITVYDWSEFAALNTLQLARSTLDVQFTFADSAPTVWTFNPMRFSVRPIFDLVPNMSKVYVGATTAADDPTTTPGNWTDLGTLFEDSTIELNINSKNDGLGLPYYHSVTFNHNIKFANDPTANVGTTLATYDRAKCRVAVLHPDGKYLIYENVTCQVQRAGAFGLGEFATYDVSFSRTAENALSILTIPTTPPDYLYAFELSIQAASAAQSDYFTET